MGKNILLFLFIVVAGAVLVIAGSGHSSQAGQADRIMKACREESNRQLCYDTQIPKLMDKFSMEEVFAVTKLIQKEDPSYAYCHVLGHTISARETKKDPNKWKEVITRCPSGVCSNGCIHGAFQERFREESFPPEKINEIMPELSSVCEARGNWKPTGLERGSCYHAVGHLLMYITKADVAQAVARCEKIADKGNNGDFRTVCFDGAFMQLYQPLEPEDRALIAGKEVTRDTHASFCGQFSGGAKTSCVIEGWPLTLDDLVTDGGVLRHCRSLSGEEKNRCLNSLYYILLVQFRFDLSAMQNYCVKLPKTERPRCFAMTASRLIETDYDNANRAISWCGDNATDDPDGVCFRQLAEESAFVFQSGTNRFNEFCPKLPDRWQKACVEKKN